MAVATAVRTALSLGALRVVVLVGATTLRAAPGSQPIRGEGVRTPRTGTLRADTLPDERLADATRRVQAFTCNLGRSISLVQGLGS